MSKDVPLERGFRPPVPERVAFEAWKLKQGGHYMSRNNAPGSDLNGYQDAHTQGQWEAWQAAVAAECKPHEPLTDAQIYDMCSEANRGYCIEREHYAKAVRDAERAHGIGA